MCFIVVALIGIEQIWQNQARKREPEYSMFSYIAMMACAALASASMFWSFTEWAYYTITPGLGLEPLSQEAMKFLNMHFITGDFWRSAPMWQLDWLQPMHFMLEK